MRRNGLLKSTITLLFSICCLTGCGDKHPDTVLTRFINYDETILYTNTISYGADALYVGDTPRRPSLDPAFVYEFTGWNNSLTNITKDTTFIAQYQKKDAEYTVKFQNYDGTNLYSTTVKYGENASYVGDVPTKPSTEFATYEFIGWDKELSNVSSDFTTTALFKENPIKITISIDLNGGSFAEPTSMLVSKGATFKDLSLPTPNKKIDGMSILFLGWFANIEGTDTQLTNSFIFNENITITARWECYTFKGIYDGKELYSDVFLDGDTFYKDYSRVSSIFDDDKNTYDFVSWDVDSDFIIHSDLILNATFELTEFPELELELMVPFGSSWSNEISKATREFKKLHDKINIKTYSVGGYSDLLYRLKNIYVTGGELPSMLMSLSSQLSSSDFESFIEPSEMLWGDTGIKGYDGGDVQISNDELSMFDMQLFRTNYQENTPLPCSYSLFANQYVFIRSALLMDEELYDTMFSFNDSLTLFGEKLEIFKKKHSDKYPLVVNSRKLFENIILSTMDVTKETLTTYLDDWSSKGLINFCESSYASNSFVSHKAIVSLDLLSSINYYDCNFDFDVVKLFQKEMPTVVGGSSVCQSVGDVYSLAFTKGLSKAEEKACCQFYKFLIETDALVNLIYSQNMHPVNKELKNFDSFKALYNNEINSTKKNYIDLCIYGQSIYPISSY